MKQKRSLRHYEYGMALSLAIHNRDFWKRELDRMTAHLNLYADKAYIEQFGKTDLEDCKLKILTYSNYVKDWRNKVEYYEACLKEMEA